MVKLTIVQNGMPVSYTHLDVYKRQDVVGGEVVHQVVLHHHGGVGEGADHVADEREHRMVPVSSTHLGFHKVVRGYFHEGRAFREFFHRHALALACLLYTSLSPFPVFKARCNSSHDSISSAKFCTTSEGRYLISRNITTKWL